MMGRREILSCVLWLGAVLVAAQNDTTTYQLTNATQSVTVNGTSIASTTSLASTTPEVVLTTGPPTVAPRPPTQPVGTPVPVATTTVEPTLVPPNFATLYKEKLLFTVIKVPVTQDVSSEAWRNMMESRLGDLCRAAILQYLLGRTQIRRRRKRLSSNGDVNLQLVHVARTNPSIKEKVTMTYIVSQQNSVLPATQVERAVASLSVQEAALQLGYPVYTAAEAVVGTELYTSTDAPTYTPLEIGLITTISVLGGVVVIGVLCWFVCCCVATQTRNRAEFKRVDIEHGQPQLISAVKTQEPTTTPASGEGPRRTLPEPATTSASKYKTESSDDGFSEGDSKTKQSSTSSTPPVDQHSKAHHGLGRRHSNRIAPSLATDSEYADRAIYASIDKLPPIDKSRPYLVSSGADRAELEYYRNKQHNRSLRNTSRAHSSGILSRRKPSKRAREMDADSDTGVETDELIEEMGSNRARMHRLLDDVLAIASPTPSKKHKDSGSAASSKHKKKDKKKKDKKKSKSSGSSDSSSSSSSSSDSSKSSKRSDKDSDKDSKSSHKKKTKKKGKKASSPREDEKKDSPHEPLSLGSTGDPYSQFSPSPYSASDQVAKLQLSGSAETSAWVMGSPPPTGSTTTLGSTAHDWSTRKTLHIPKPKLGTPELNQLANIKSAANDDNYTSLVLSTAMFRAQSPSWNDAPT